MATYVPLHPLPLQFQDTVTSLNMSGGTIEFFLAGTATPTNLFSDNAGTSIGTSITLNSGGMPESGGNVITLFRDADIDLKLVLKNAAGATISTADNLQSPSQFLSQSQIGAILYPQTPAESSAGVTPVNKQYPPGHVYRLKENDGSDMITALQQMLTFCCTYGVRFIAPGGVYATTDTLVIDAFTPGKACTFEALEQVRIVCSDTTVPVVDIGGRSMTWIGDWSFEHSSLPSSANTSALGWRINNYISQSVFEKITFTKNYAGIQPAQSGGFGGSNVMFSCEFGHLTITQFSGFAAEFDGAPAGGYTPVFIAGCYINNLDDDGSTKLETSSNPLLFRTGDAIVFGHCHLENFIAPGVAFLASDTGVAKFNVMHVEGFEANGQNQLFDLSSNAGLQIGQLYLNGSSLEAANMGGNTYGLFRLAAGAQVQVDRFYEITNTVDITTWRVARSNSADINSAVWINGGKVTTATGGTYTTILLTADTSQETQSGLPSILRRWLGKDAFHVHDHPNNIYEWWTAGGSAPTGGTWTRGSFVWNQVPSSGSPIGWICVSAGTPGTWEPVWAAGSLEDNATNIADMTAGINTTGKVKGKEVWDNTNKRKLRASGSGATDDWEVVDGSAQVTPS